MTTHDRTTDSVTTVRERTDDDLADAGAALIEVHERDGYPVEGVDDPQAWLTSSHLLRAWVGELDGRIVGHVAITRPQSGDAAVTMWIGTAPGDDANRVGVLGRLFVLPAARGHALGEHLISAATSYAHDHGLRLVLDVMDKDGAAIHLYERLGWTRLGTTQHDNGKGQTVRAYCYVSPSGS